VVSLALLGASVAVPDTAAQSPPSAALAVAAPRAPLLDVGVPGLDDVEPVVRTQVTEAVGSLRRLLDDARGGRAWADAYGALGRVLHAYEFTEAAAACYENAARLAPGDARWPHSLGALLQQVGDWDRAARWLEQARRDDPRNTAATVRLADTYLQLDRLRDAREIYEQVADVYPALALRGLGEVALREGRFVDAARHLRSALERVPAATALHYPLAMAYRGQGRLDEARRELAKQGAGEIRLGDPVLDGIQALVRSERGLIAIGRRAFEAGQFDAAAQAFERATVAAPASPVALANFGLARLRLGDERAARAAFERALGLDAAEPVAHAGLGAILIGQGRDVDALPHLRAAVDASPGDVNASRQLVRALVRLRHVDAAVVALGRARAAGLDDEDAALGLALLLAEGQRFGDAVRVLGEAVHSFPESAPVATTLARLLAAAPDAAVRDGARALALATTTYDRDPVAVHAETVALALAELGRCAEAGAWLEKGIGHADASQDIAELARLKALRPVYARAACRAAGR
jgi:tetratricopeptide (TPR) repeat protein